MYRRMVEWLMNDEMERMRKDAVFASFKISWHSPGRTEENQET
jgi:hypothetical protein